MCLAGIALDRAAGGLLVAANRDERHARPSLAAGWWPDAPDVFGGRDPVGGGSWLAISRAGRFALVTNRADRPAPAAAASRGALVRDFVTGRLAPGAYLERVAERLERFAGFSLVVGALGDEVLWLSAGPGPVPERGEHPGGVLAISNAPPAADWPKTRFLAAGLGKLGAPVATGDVLGLLERRMPLPGDAGLPPAARLPFIAGAEYGTRAATIVRVDGRGVCQVLERRYGPGGRPDGESAAHFTIA